MRDKEEFFDILTEIDGQPVEQYGRLVGDFDFSRFVVKLSPFPDRGFGEHALFVVRVPQSVAGFPASLMNTPVRRTALEDFLTRRCDEQIQALARFDERGVSRRRLTVAAPGQKILPRSSMVLAEEYIEARFYVDWPVDRGRVAGDSAKEVFFDELPRVVNQSLVYCNLIEGDVMEFVDLMEMADQLRQVLPTRGWVGFVGEGAMLCRLGATDLPDYERIETVTFSDDLIVEVEAPNMSPIRGFGIPAGVTVILGDLYSGRRELVRALAAGIYNHVPGDGRELVVAVPDAVYVKAEPGRSVQRVDISPFLSDGRDGMTPSDYSVASADAFTSQAASTIEALEVGAHVLLLEESDSSPAFLVRDERLAGVAGLGTGQVTPLCARARQLVDELGVSIVIGGSNLVADFIPIADTVLRVTNYRVEDVTKEAKALGLRGVVSPASAIGVSELAEHSRSIVPSSIDPSAGLHDTHVDTASKNTLEFGRSHVDLSSVVQLADVHQTRTLGLILAYAKTRYMGEESRPIRELLDLVDRDLSTDGLECLTRDLRGDLTRPRRYEIAAALNRLDTLRIASPAT